MKESLFSLPLGSGAARGTLRTTLVESSKTHINTEREKPQSAQITESVNNRMRLFLVNRLLWGDETRRGRHVRDEEQEEEEERRRRRGSKHSSSAGWR